MLDRSSGNDFRIQQMLSMKCSSKFDSEPSENSDALILSYNLIDSISPVCYKGTKLIFPIDASKDVLYFKFREYLLKYL